MKRRGVLYIAPTAHYLPPGRLVDPERFSFYVHQQQRPRNPTEARNACTDDWCGSCLCHVGPPERTPTRLPGSPTQTISTRVSTHSQDRVVGGLGESRALRAQTAALPSRACAQLAAAWWEDRVEHREVLRRVVHAMRSAAAALAHRHHELVDVDRLGEVAIEARLEETLAVSLHRLRRQRDDGDRPGPVVAA
jgi:hypothetical protein